MSIHNPEPGYAPLYQQFRGFVEGFPDAIILFSERLEEVWFNSVAQSFRTPQDGSVDDCCAGSFAPCEPCPIRIAAEGATSERTVKRRDGSSWRIRGIPLYAAAGKLINVLMIASDISREVALQQEAARSSHLASLGELSAGVAHEINNPNGLILMNLSLLKDVFRDALPVLEAHAAGNPRFALAGLEFGRLKEEVPFLLSEMHDGARRIKRIVEELKEFARGAHADQDERFDLNVSIRKAVRMVTFIIQKYTDYFNDDLADALPVVQGNSQRLEQVIINLLINACQALRSKKEGVRIRTELAPCRELVRIVVEDDGIGIDPDHIPHLTDPFFTTRRNSGGTGLGLSVSARIIKEHRGRMEFFSLPGEGTRVVVELPVLEVVK